MENRLRFETVGTGKTYAIHNMKNEIIGFVERVRTGRFMHYCQTIPFTLMKECVDRSEGLIFSPGCQDEIREFCKKLNGGKKDGKD